MQVPPWGLAIPGASVPLAATLVLPPPRCPHPHTPRLTGAYDFLNVDPGGLDLPGEVTARPARLLIGVWFCIELRLRDLPPGVVQGQEDGWGC